MLNPSQQKAVEEISGPCLVIAGAGTGKTKTIVEKLAFLVKSGVDPARILALTFSNEAAAQMKTKAEELTPEARHMHISTFHSFCADFIRAHASQCEVPENFSIVEELDAAILLKKQLSLDTGRALRYANTIAKAKDLSLTPDDYKKYLHNQESLLSMHYRRKDWEVEYGRSLVRLRTLHMDTVKSKEERERLSDFIRTFESYRVYRDFYEAWKGYEELKRGSLDYADLNRIVLDYVDKYGPADLAESFDYIIVDEFQDTNRVQFDLLSHLTSRRKNITVVGDQNQTVYAFRGAYADNIQKFVQAFNLKPDDIIHLDINYRSSDRILRTAHSLITNNYDRAGASILLRSAEGIEGEKVRIIQTEDHKEQARRVVEEIESLTTNGLAYRDIAILYRSHSSASALKKALQNRGLPYVTAGGSEFFYQPEIKTAASFLYVLNNFSNPMLQADQAWWKLLHTRFGLSGLDSTLLAEFKKKKRYSLQEVLYKHINYVGLSKDGKERIEKLKRIIDGLRTKTNKRLSDLLLEIYSETGLARSDSREAMQNLRYLHNLAMNFETFHGDDLASFIAYIELVDEMGGGLPAARLVKEESIKLMTIHAAKGLEFPAVIVIDLVKDKFPLTRGGVEPLIPIELNEQYNEILSQNYSDERDKEKAIREFTSLIKLREERRLAYVALTRAKSSLYLTLAKDYGGKEIREPSPFLFEIGAQPVWFAKEEAVGEDLHFISDNEIKAKEGGDTELDRAALLHKRLMMSALDMRDMKAAQYHMIIYQSLLDGQAVGKGLAAREARKILQSIRSNNPTGLRFNPSAVAFSVTSMGTFLECPKKYELKEVLRMPSRDDEEGEGALGFGSVIHEVLDLAVKTRVMSREDLDKVLKDRTAGLKDFDLGRAQQILDVFWHRNHKQLDKVAATELYFRFPLEGFLFSGKIDRVDNIGDGKVRIIDYKTGYVNSDVSKDDRERQLLLYALAVRHDPLLKKNNWTPAELVLEMLEKEKPLEFILEDGQMIAPGTRIRSAGIDEIEKQVVETAKKIAQYYEQGFPVAETDIPCRWCSYKLYCPKWG